MRVIKKAYYIAKNQGFAALYERAGKKLAAGKKAAPLSSYSQFIKRIAPNENELNLQRVNELKINPKISFLCPAYNTKPKFFNDLIDSFKAQTYGNWQLCIADGGSKAHNIKLIKEQSAKDSRIIYTILGENKGIGANTAAAFEISDGDYIAFIDHDDKLAKNACYELVCAIINSDGADFFYSDEDKFDASGHFSPHFKPDYSPETLRSYNYITHLMMMSRSLYLKVGGMRYGFDGSQDHDLALRATSQAAKIIHIPKVLYHWRSHAGSIAGDGQCKSYAFEAGRKAVDRIAGEEGGYAVFGSFDGSYRSIYPISGKHLISIIIPNKDKVSLLKGCIDSIKKFADMDYEIIIVENGSKEPQTDAYYKELNQRQDAKILLLNSTFNYSHANNYGAKHASGNLLLFLNNDIEACSEGFMSALAQLALRSHIAAVGAKLLFQDGKVQHAGVVVGLGGWADHVCAHMCESGEGGMSNHIINSIRNVSAVTGACMMLEKQKFDKLGGFDESFVLCGSDVEICLRALEMGYRNVYTPFARLYHHESATRKNDAIPKGDFARSFIAYRKYLEKGDPYYNPNLDYSNTHLDLSRDLLPPIFLNPVFTGGNFGN